MNFGSRFRNSMPNNYRLGKFYDSCYYKYYSHKLKKSFKKRAFAIRILLPFFDFSKNFSKVGNILPLWILFYIWRVREYSETETPVKAFFLLQNWRLANGFQKFFEKSFRKQEQFRYAYVVKIWKLLKKSEKELMKQLDNHSRFCRQSGSFYTQNYIFKEAMPMRVSNGWTIQQKKCVSTP